jgi:hypothetical protein
MFTGAVSDQKYANHGISPHKSFCGWLYPLAHLVTQILKLLPFLHPKISEKIIRVKQN